MKRSSFEPGLAALRSLRGCKDDASGLVISRSLSIGVEQCLRTSGILIVRCS